jgi:hypothetical protein
MWDDGSALRNE